MVGIQKKIEEDRRKHYRSRSFSQGATEARASLRKYILYRSESPISTGEAKRFSPSKPYLSKMIAALKS
jgi:hypothetical protein